MKDRSGGMESSKLSLSLENLRSPRSPRRSPFLDTPRSEMSSGASTPFASAPSSPRYYYYFSAPASPPHEPKVDDGAAAIPFSWEEKPGTPKRSKATENAFSFTNSSSQTTSEVRVVEESDRTSSVDYLSSMGFHFSAPVSPQREVSSPRFGSMMKDPGFSRTDDDEFEFTSARMSEADSFVSGSMSHADELFFEGQLLPLKLPPRLQQRHKDSHLSFDAAAIEVTLSHRTLSKGSAHSPRSSRTLPLSPKSSSRSILNARGHQRAHSHFFSSNSSLDSNSSQQVLKGSRSKPSTRKSLRELLHFRPKQQNVQSRSSSTSSTNSSSIFSNPNSRSSSTKSNGRSSISSSGSSSKRQVSPVSSRELLHYGKVASKNVEELRRRTFLPYKQGLLGLLGCINVSSVLPGLREQEV